MLSNPCFRILKYNFLQTFFEVSKRAKLERSSATIKSAVTITATALLLLASCEREVPVPVSEAVTRVQVDSAAQLGLILTVDTAWAGETFIEF